jgi:beta-lactamase regulating signal transducer with metallopeptidase domain
MKTLETLLAQPLVAALGWALLHFVWQGTLMALLLGGLLRILRQRSANARYAVACAALLVMAVLPLATMVKINSSMPAKEAGESPLMPAGKTALHPLTVETEAVIAPTQKSLAGASIQLWPSNWFERLEPLLPWAILLWLLGVAFFSLRLGRAWIYTQRLRVRGTRPLVEEWQQALQRLCRQLRVTRPVRFLESTFITVPTVIGWLRPVILLPVGALTGLSPQQLESIIAHELAHIRRHDYLINLLQAVIETLLFYHPAVWWVSRRIGQERELCCDDVAVAVCGDPLTYARALFEMEQLRAARPQLAVAANGGLLMNRIERLVGVRPQPANRFAGGLACLLVLTAVISVGAGAQILLPAPNQSRASAGIPATDKSEALARSPLDQAFQEKGEQVRKKAAEALGLLKQSNDEASAAQKTVREDLPEREETTYRYQLTADARVEVSYILGSVEIEATDSDSAEVYIVRSANAKADLERFDHIFIEQTPSRLVLRGEDSKSNGIEIRHHLRLRLPKNSRLSLREVNGRVSINGMEGAIRLNEINGGALIPQVSGELEMEGVNGKISLGLTRLVPNGIRLRDVGSVELQVAEDVNAELEIGELEATPLLETPRARVNRTGEKNFQVRIGTGGPVIRIIDVNGRVSIRNP